VVLLAAGLPIAQPAAALEGFALEGDLLVHLDLGSGASAEIGSHGLFAFALAYSPDGVLYAAGKRQGIPENPQELWILDQATGQRTLVGQLSPSGVALVGDLTFDDSGALWVVLDGQLHSVDLGSGVATRIGDEEGWLQGLAEFGGTFYGIESDDPFGGGPPWRLVTVDEATGVTAPILDLPALSTQDILAMDFDTFGRLWVLGLQFFPTPGVSRLLRLDDPFSGEVELIHELDSDFGVEGLALVPSLSSVEVPALGGAGAAALATLLVAVACRTMRRRQRAG
jgi:hypothetical protein